MLAVIVDMWSVGRPDMSPIAQACERCEIWGDAAAKSAASHMAGGLDMHDCPTLHLDWDGATSPHGGPVARIVATGQFKDPRTQIIELARAAGLPVIDHKASSSRLELRMSAPLRPEIDIGGLELQEKDSRDPRVVLAPRRPMGR